MCMRELAGGGGEKALFPVSGFDVQLYKCSILLDFFLQCCMHILES